MANKIRNRKHPKDYSPAEQELMRQMADLREQAYEVEVQARMFISGQLTWVEFGELLQLLADSAYEIMESLKEVKFNKNPF